MRRARDNGGWPGGRPMKPATPVGKIIRIPRWSEQIRRVAGGEELPCSTVRGGGTTTQIKRTPHSCQEQFPKEISYLARLFLNTAIELTTAAPASCDNAAAAIPTKTRMNPYGYRKKLLGMLGAMLLAAGASAATPAQPVRLMAQEGIAPKWIMYDDHAEGICPAIIVALERAEPRLRFYGYAQGRALPAIEAGLASGEVQAACALLDSPRRRAVARTAGKPLYMVRHRLAGRADDAARVRDIGDLARLRALVNVAPNSAMVERLRGAGVAVDESSGDSLVMLRKVLAGHGRFTYMNELTLERNLRAAGLEERIRALPLVSDEPAWFWVSRKANPQVARLIEGALARAQASGELERIHARWSKVP
jgi:glutamate/aspartate transport system substrate-binding protein